jgi:hypothetical protein
MAALKILVVCLQSNGALEHGQYPEQLRIYMDIAKDDASDMTLPILHDLRMPILEWRRPTPLNQPAFLPVSCSNRAASPQYSGLSSMPKQRAAGRFDRDHAAAQERGIDRVVATPKLSPEGR